MISNAVLSSPLHTSPLPAVQNGSKRHAALPKRLLSTRIQPAAPATKHERPSKCGSYQDHTYHRTTLLILVRTGFSAFEYARISPITGTITSCRPWSRILESSGTASCMLCIQGDGGRLFGVTSNTTRSSTQAHPTFALSHPPVLMRGRSPAKSHMGSAMGCGYALLAEGPRRLNCRRQADLPRR
jgi:hypothetical protein